MSESTGDSQAINDWVLGNWFRAEAALQKHHEKPLVMPDSERERLEADFAFWEALKLGIRAGEPEALSKAGRLWKLAGGPRARDNATG